MDNKELIVPVDAYVKEIKSEAAIRWEESRSEAYKEYRRKWVENPKKFILENGPINLDLESTNICNLECPMCPRTVMLKEGKQSSDKKMPVGFMDINFYKNLVDQAVEMGVMAIKLNWLGEPTTHKDIVEMVRYAKEKGILDVLMNTNAVLLNEKMTRDLITAGLDKLIISFDSPIKEDYEKIRIGAKYEKVLENVRNISKIRNELGTTSPLTRISMVAMKENYSQFDEFVKLFKDYIDIIAWLEYTDFENMSGTERKVTKRERIKNFACAQLWQRMFVTWDGEVIVCCNDVNRMYVVGNAHTEKLKDIWKNKKYQMLREKHQSGEYDDISICSMCDLPEFK